MVAISRFQLTLWSNDLQRAQWAERAGVDRIGVDLETRGKAQRQAGLDTWISPHTIDDLRRIRPHLHRAAAFVRCNALHSESEKEIDVLLDAGASVVMIPNFSHASEVESFLGWVDGRARVVPLVERRAAVATIADLASLGIREIHVGLNDLSIDLAETNRLVVLALPILDELAEAAQHCGVRFGLGGLGRASDDALPVPSELVYAQHARLRSSGALLARSFFTPSMDESGFAEELGRLHVAIDSWRSRPSADLEYARQALERYRGVRT
jgi:citrate lyase beta subunit